MKRLGMQMIVAASVLAASSGSVTARQRDVQVRTEKITDSVYVLYGSGGNIGLCVGEDGAFMIDDQYAPLTGKILAAVAEITDDKVEFLVNTHWHGDHVGGNENMAGEGTIIVAHENVRARMSTEQFMEAFNNTVPASPETARPVITFSDNMTFHWNDDEIRIFHVADAHTDGDSILHFVNNNVIHMGDTFFNGMYPFIDTSSGGSIDGIIAAADAVLQRIDDDTKIIPGHGPLTDVAGLKAYRAVMADVRAEVVKLIEAGKSKDEVIAAKPTAKHDEVWGGGFMQPDVFTGLVYDSLADAS